MSSNTITGNSELMNVIESVAEEKGLTKNDVLIAIQESISIAARKKYGKNRNIVTKIDQESGEIKLFLKMIVKSDEQIESMDDNYITMLEAEKILKAQKQYDKKVEVDDEILEPIPPLETKRMIIQVTKNEFLQRIENIIRLKQYELFKKREGQIVYGTVKQYNGRNAIVDVYNAEAHLGFYDLLPNDNIKLGDKISAYIKEVVHKPKGPQIFLSRTSNKFLEKLFEQEIPEIEEGVIEIKGIAREPGSRAKVSVFSSDKNVDVIGSCIGVRGIRIQNINKELQGEKIDVIEWSNESVRYVLNALSVNNITKVVVDEENKKIEVVVPEDQLKVVIGRKGQNVRLVSKLLGWQIKILDEETESKQKQQEFKKITELFSNVLEIDETQAQILVVEGVNSIDDITMLSPEDIAQVEGINIDVATKLYQKAIEYQKNLEQNKIENYNQNDDSFNTHGNEKISVALIPQLTTSIIDKLIENNVKIVTELADLSRDEMIEILDEVAIDLSEDIINNIIMKARKIAYNI